MKTILGSFDHGGREHGGSWGPTGSTDRVTAERDSQNNARAAKEGRPERPQPCGSIVSGL